MKCTKYARGMFLSPKIDTERVIEELQKEYPHKRPIELKALALEGITVHNRAINMQMKLGGGRVSYYENGSNEYKSVAVTGIDIDAKGVVTVETDGEIDLRFQETKNGIIGNVQSDDAKAMILNTPRFEEDIDSVFNTDIDQDSMNAAFGDRELLSEKVEAVQAAMAEIDKNAVNSEWDVEHSEYLRGVTKRMSELVNQIKTLKITVTKDTVEGLVEPLGEFNPKRAGDKVRLATAGTIDTARNRFLMGNEETMVHETVHAYMSVLFNKKLGVLGQDVKDDLRRLYTKAKKETSYKDLLPEENGPYSEVEVAKAKETYDYIFTGKLDDFSQLEADVRLQEFIAYGMSNKRIRAMLSNIKLDYKEIKAPDGATMLSKLFHKLMDIVQKLVFKVRVKAGRSTNVEAELTRLSYKLGEVNKVYGDKAKDSAGIPLDEKMTKEFENAVKKVDDTLHKGLNTLLDKVKLNTPKDETKANARVYELLDYVNKQSMKAEEGGMLAKMWYGAKMIPAMSKLYTMISNKDTDKYIEYRVELDFMLKKTFGEGHQFVQDLIADFSAGRKTLEQVTDMTMKFKSHLDRMRDMHFKGTLRDIGDGFTKLNIYAHKNKKYNVAMNRVIVRSDFQAVSTDANELVEYLDDKKLNREIARLESEVDAIELSMYGETTKVGSRMIGEAKKVAEYMVTKKGLRSNANNIARNFGTANAVDELMVDYISYNVRDTEAKIDRLISLYALQKVDKEQKELIRELVELDPNGVSNYLRISKGVQVATKEDWEQNGVLQDMVKGYVKERVDANKDLTYAETDRETMKKMITLGYRLVRKLDKDSGDITGNSIGLYAHDNVGVTKRVDGGLGLQRLQIKGLLLSEKVRIENPHLDQSMLNEKIRIAIRTAAKKSKIENMYPVYADNGFIIDYRYEPKLDEMEKYLDMETRGTDLTARSFGQKDTQKYTDVNNEKLVDMIMADTRKTLDKVAPSMKKKVLDREFVRVYATNNRLNRVEMKSKVGEDDGARFVAKTEGEELWGLLPPATRKYIVEKNRQRQVKMGDIDAKGNHEIYIRKDLMKQLFGYNQAMLTNSKLFSRLGPEMVAKLNKLEIKAAEVMAIAKSMVVIKLPSTVVGNIVSNAKFLFFSGISPVKSVRYLLLSKKSLDKWKIDEKARRTLERKIDTLDGKAKDKAKKELGELVAKMADNPIIPLINEGVYQTIAEDVNLEEDSNSVVNWVESKIENSIIGENKTINEVINTVFLTRKSKIGELLLNITQESDFHFRAALYWNAMENGNSHDEAVRMVVDKFINYSKVINSKYVQWLDRMGPEAFWKYFANIQRVNLGLIKKNTTKVLIDTGAKEYLGVPADVLDSSIVMRWGNRLNPFSWLDKTESLITGATEVPITNLVDGW